MTVEEFQQAIKELGIELTAIQEEQLEQFYRMMIEWNTKINLTRITEKEEVYLKHFYDSLTLIKAIPLNEIDTVCDVGTGAGFPGIVLKIVFPNLKVTLIDSLQKRVRYLDLVIQELGLQNIEAIHSRGEDYARLHREEFDLLTSRAVARLKVIAEICIPMVKVNGYFIPMKANLTDEVEEASDSMKRMNATLEEIISFELPKENSQRTLVKIHKEKATSSIYPRSMEKIKR